MAYTTKPQPRSMPGRGWSPTTAAANYRPNAAAADRAQGRSGQRGRMLRQVTATLVLVAQSVMSCAAEPAETEQQRIDDVKAAVIMANGLEREYWDNPSAFPDWDAIYAHFRRGYSAEIAERMTAFTLDNDGDLATWVPNDVHVVEVDDNSALAYFDTPPDFGLDGLWGFEAYMVVRLRREDGRWIIDWATDSATPPLPQDGS